MAAVNGAKIKSNFKAVPCVVAVHGLAFSFASVNSFVIVADMIGSAR